MYKHSAQRSWIVAFSALIAFAAWGVVANSAVPFASDAERTAARRSAQQLIKDGNFKQALPTLRQLVLDKQNTSPKIAGDLAATINCLRNLNQLADTDELFETAAEIHANNPRMLQAVARSYFDGPHYGSIIAGKFSRGQRQGRIQFLPGRRIGGQPAQPGSQAGRQVNSTSRDRVRALQLMQQASALDLSTLSQTERAEFARQYARFVFANAGGSWKLQALTNLDKLPDYDSSTGYGWGRSYRAPVGAPVDAEGNPVLHSIPESYAAATSDGQRWRWLLADVVRQQPKLSDTIDFELANFHYGQFGVQTMNSGRRAAAGKPKEDGPLSVHTLSDSETIARMANGIKRFKLSGDSNFIKVYERLSEGDNNVAEQSLSKLASIFENRRQYSKAAQKWQLAAKRYNKKNYRAAYAQITGKFGQFEATKTQPAGTGPQLNFKYRNASSVKLKAERIDVAKMLADAKAYLNTRPTKLDRKNLNISNIGYRLVTENSKQYVKEQVANWSVDLQPDPDHFDKQVAITTPLQQAGAYLVTATVENGNVSRIIVWVNDTVLVKKQMATGPMYLVADAVTGQPLSGVNVEFLGYQQKRIQNTRTYSTTVSNFAMLSDNNGLVMPNKDQLSKSYTWVVIARSKATGQANRLAFLGFQGIWWNDRVNPFIYDQAKSFGVTDRPVYRPEQSVKFKIWLRRAKFDAEGSEFANQNFTVTIRKPDGSELLKKDFTTDEFGGIASEVELADDAKLGTYRIALTGIVNGRKSNFNAASFRVEEYKKPEYEVVVESPDKPVMLGDKIPVTIKANYYFGAPVANAKVRYTVQRTTHDQSWYPSERWDWMYGSGYWWFAADSDWYPGWNRWGCFAPVGWWWGQRPNPPEKIVETEAQIGADGKVTFEIDTAIAKELHGDHDHKYQITAEVTDQSRRTIVGTGSVTVARQPFKVFTWTNKGHYQPGETIELTAKALTPDQKPVAGPAVIRLLNITYDKNGKPTETEIESFNVETNSEGIAKLKLKAATAGQYRLACSITDAEGHTIEGGYLINVKGQANDGSQFRFNDLELITDKKHYQPGEQVQLMINTNRPGSVVALFVRPVNSAYPKPQMIRLQGKSTIVPIDITASDMPNVFVEALTISNGKIHVVTREIIVPPTQRVANVEITPSAKKYGPGDKASMKLKLTDENGKPFLGSTVLCVYDKSVDAVAGGSNIGNIREFFWKTRRRHYPQTQSSFDRSFGNLLKKGEVGMRRIGVFGGMTAPGNRPDPSNGMARGGLGGGGVMEMAADSAPVAMSMSRSMKSAPAAGGVPNAVEPTVRKEFADTAYWTAHLTTDAKGEAEVDFDMPDNLTTWKVKVWSLGHGTRVGEADVEVITSKDLLVRLQAPRFFTETDEVVLSAIVHNYLDAAKQVQVVLEVEGGTLEPLDSPSQTVEVSASGERRIDWRVKVVKAGEAVIRMKALTDQESDAVEMTFPVQVHGILKTESWAGSIRPEQKSSMLTVKVPGERNVDQTKLEIRYSPSLAVSMVDALPYLLRSPHKTSDCTLHRFVPAVIVQNTLKRMNIDIGAVKNKVTNLNAQELGDDKLRAQQWKRFSSNPIFDQKQLDKIVNANLRKITEMQLSDGGWGWLSGYGERSSAHITAQIVHGLQLAQQNGLAIVPDVMTRGTDWLANWQNQQVTLLKNAARIKANPKLKVKYRTSANNLDSLVYMVLVDADVKNDEMKQFLYRDRISLSVYAKAMFGLALHKQADVDKLKMLVSNVRQFIRQDDENQTAWIDAPDTGWWFWYHNSNEANSYALKLMSKVSPKDPINARLAKYLINNRKNASAWASTRATATAIEALGDYLLASGELTPDMQLEVWLDGRKRKEVKITADNLFTFDNQLVVEGEDLAAGDHQLEIRRTGTGPVYFNAYLTNFTKEASITKAGLEIKVNRKFYRLTEDKDATALVAGSRGQAIDQSVKKYNREELVNFATLQSGDLVEIELEIDSKNDYEYLVFDDLKPSGFEPVDIRSGYGAKGVYFEFRDERVTFYMRSLSHGKHSTSYRVRAEIPGRFSALPAKGMALYAPELRANSDEAKFVIED